MRQTLKMRTILSFLTRGQTRDRRPELSKAKIYFGCGLSLEILLRLHNSLLAKNFFPYRYNETVFETIVKGEETKLGFKVVAGSMAFLASRVRIPPDLKISKFQVEDTQSKLEIKLYQTQASAHDVPNFPVC